MVHPKEKRAPSRQYLKRITATAEDTAGAEPREPATPPLRTSTEKLDREYAEKKARQAAAERRRNGG